MDPTAQGAMSRRTFLAGAGALVVAWHLPAAAAPDAAFPLKVAPDMLDS